MLHVPLPNNKIIVYEAPDYAKLGVDFTYSGSVPTCNHVMIVFCVNNFKVASSEGDVDHYVNIRRLLYSIFNILSCA
jgi:hypothetical protein